MWNQEHLPQEFRDATIVHIYKRKRNHQLCDNHRGISLLSKAGKVLACVLSIVGSATWTKASFLRANVASVKVKGPLTWSLPPMSSRRKVWSTMLFHTFFLELVAAFDTVSWDGLWKIMEKCGWPTKFITIVSLFHDGIMGCVLDNGEPSEAFPVTNRVK